MDYNEILLHVVNKMGKPPRKFSLLDRMTWFKQDKPEWNWEDDEIKHSVNNWSKVFTHGKITWGHIIQVNTLMFEKSKSNCPGDVLLLLEKSSPFSPESLEIVSEKLIELKGYSEYIDDTSEKKFSQYLENQLTRAYGVKVPDSISNGLDCSVSTVFFQRRHIPHGVITSSLFPTLYLDEPIMVAAMVPFNFWPKEFVLSWH